MEVPVFSNGTWISYPSPPSVSWPSSYHFKAAAAYAKALHLGYTAKESATLAECSINKLLYPGIEYSKKLESDLSRLVRE